MHCTACLICLVLPAVLAGPAFAQGDKDTIPTNPMNDITIIRDWILLGPFPNPRATTPLPDGLERAGLEADYLAAIGGEANPTVTLETKVPIPENGAEASARAVTADDAGSVDLAKIFNNVNNAVVYAVARVQAPEDMQASGLFGSDDWAKVFVNGAQVHRKAGPGGRGVTPREDHFPVPLKKGLNIVVVKVEQADGGWGFMLELASPEEAKRIEAQAAHARLVRRAMGANVAPSGMGARILQPGPFPEVGWEQPETMAAAFGEAPMKVRWFDPDLNEVTSADKPGRYMAYAEMTLPDGRIIRRAATFYRPPERWAPWEEEMPLVPLPHMPGSGVERATWDQYDAYLREAGGRIFLDRLFSTQEGPVMLAGLAEARPLDHAPTQLDMPEMRHQDYSLRLKMKVLGIGDRVAVLKPPRKKTGAPSTTLHAGTPAEANVKPEMAAAVRDAAQVWYDATKIPMTVLVARHGVIAFHEAIGGTPEHPVTLATKYPLASLTKTHAGLLLAQFLDQGLIRLDDPVGKYLPDFPTTGDKVITVRQCITHTTGLEGHGEWGGMDNPFLDNAIANGLETLEPGTRYIYNGMGFDLAGKVMEVVSGKSIFRLFHENFFGPMGDDNPTIEDLGFGITCTVADLARTGQMMLNRGSYGDTEFFSADTFENQVRPRPLKEFFPKLKNERENRYNMGMNYADDGGADTPILGKNTLTHGSATGAVLRVDYDHDLVVAIARPAPGPEYSTHLTAVLRAVAAGLE